MSARVAIVAGALAVVALAACGGSGGRVTVCAGGGRGDVTGPLEGLAPRRHDVATVDSAWRERIVTELEGHRADTTVRLLLVHRTAPATADRERVTTGGGTVLGESPQWNGLQAAFAVGTLRTFAPTVPLDRVIDAHLLDAAGLPICAE